jgi:hypothetical protein
MTPYYFLAWDALRRGDFKETCRMCLEALRHRGWSKREQAQLHEWLGIALTELGEPMEYAMWQFQQAEALDPANARIHRNREAAVARRAASVDFGAKVWQIEGEATVIQALRGFYGDVPAARDLDRMRSKESLTGLLQHA